ncbi:MAG: DNA-protecting protein DprA [Gammaproteobacteria bacterium]|nr:DNA-protecting protein DprA [Gammaproteobacteria bacterium]
MTTPEHYRFACLPRLDASSWCRLVERVSSPLDLIGLPEDRLMSLGLSKPAALALQRNDPSRHRATLEALARHHIKIIAAHESDYPPQLLEVRGAPAVIFIRGHHEALKMPQLAMVGSRHPTANGALTARDLAFHFAQCGLAITSGLAIGIDAASHSGALAAEGTTLAVCGTGLDRIYPDTHTDLAARILDRGALISEFPPETAPLPHHFVQRNRLISGLSVGVLVIEAAFKSGSLTTARYAGDQGREVFAVPGSIHSPLSRGCHALLREGAVLVENADDVFRELKINQLNHGFTLPFPLSSAEPLGGSRLDNPSEILLDAIGFEPTSLDALIASTGLSSTSVASLLLSLETEGRIASDSSGRFYRVLQSTHIE